MAELIGMKKLRTMSEQELELHAAELLRDQFNARVKAANSELPQTHSIGARRREYARLLTVLTERRRAAKK